MNLVYLIRHGRPASVWGDDDDDPALDDTGRRQAVAIAERFMALKDAARPERVVSSPLRRCRETAQPLADALGLSVSIDARVGEIPTPSGLGKADRPTWLRAAFQGRWADVAGDIDYEAWRQGVAEAVASHAGSAVFSHFVAINAVLSVIARDPRVILFRPDHVSITTLGLGEGGVRLLERGAEAATGVL